MATSGQFPHQRRFHPCDRPRNVSSRPSARARAALDSPRAAGRAPRPWCSAKGCGARGSWPGRGRRSQPRIDPARAEYLDVIVRVDAVLHCGLVQGAPRRSRGRIERLPPVKAIVHETRDCSAATLGWTGPRPVAQLLKVRNRLRATRAARTKTIATTNGRWRSRQQAWDRPSQ